MPPSVASIYCAVLVVLILFISEIMPFCSCYVEKGLGCIMIMSPSGHQPLSCAKYIKLNMRLSCNVCSVSDVKCIYYFTFFNHLVLCLSYCRVLDLICH